MLLFHRHPLKSLNIFFCDGYHIHVTICTVYNFLFFFVSVKFLEFVKPFCAVLPEIAKPDRKVRIILNNIYILKLFTHQSCVSKFCKYTTAYDKYCNRCFLTGHWMAFFLIVKVWLKLNLTCVFIRFQYQKKVIFYQALLNILIIMKLEMGIIFWEMYFFFSPFYG